LGGFPADLVVVAMPCHLPRRWHGFLFGGMMKRLLGLIDATAGIGVPLLWLVLWVLVLVLWGVVR
jgi:hypothetical protein